MKNQIKIFLFLILPIFLVAQNDDYLTELNQGQADSLQLLLTKTNNDTLRMSIYRDLGIHYVEIKKDTAIHFLEKQIALANK